MRVGPSHSTRPELHLCPVWQDQSEATRELWRGHVDVVAAEVKAEHQRQARIEELWKLLESRDPAVDAASRIVLARIRELQFEVKS
jgi:hypothetical protein